MQKKIIVAAVAAALAAPVAMAQSTVTIGGLVKMGVEQYKITNPTAANAAAGGFNNEFRVSDQSSRIIFRVNEDLGGGMNAFVQLDARFGPDLGGIAGAPQTWANGNTHLGIGGPWGKVFLGRQDLHYGQGPLELATALTGSLQSFAGAGPMSQMNGTQIALGSRTSNVVAYDSPNLSGFTGRLAYSSNWLGSEGTGLNNGSKDGAWNLALDYAGGPLKVGYSYWNAKIEGGTDFNVLGDQRGDKLYGSYAFGPITVGLGWDKSQARLAANAPLTKRTAWMLPVTWTSGPHTAVVVYARMGNQSGGAAGQVNNDTGANMWRLSYQYALSKRTAVGVHYSKIDNKSNGSYDFFSLASNGGTNTGAGEDVRQWYFGLGHSF